MKTSTGEFGSRWVGAAEDQAAVQIFRFAPIEKKSRLAEATCQFGWATASGPRGPPVSQSHYQSMLQLSGPGLLVVQVLGAAGLLLVLSR